jgi:hypothetical protein
MYGQDDQEVEYIEGVILPYAILLIIIMPKTSKY